MNWENIENKLKRKVNMNATKIRIQKIFELYHLYKGIVALANGKTIKKIENGKISLEKINNEYIEYIDMIDSALKVLEGGNNDEYQALYDFYVKKKSGIACCIDLSMSETQYYRVKAKAVEKFARLLECEIYE